MALPLGSMIYKHESQTNEDDDMNLQQIPVYKKMWADNMIHMNYINTTCIIYKTSDCEKDIWLIWFAHARQRFQANQQNLTIPAATDIRNESGVSIIYRYCSGKNLGGTEYIDLRI